MPPLPASPLDHWRHVLASRPAPVLPATRDALARWRERPDHVDANSLADLVLRDPLMTLRVLLLVTQRLGARLSRPVETVTAGLVLLGIEPFFAAFDTLETVQERLAGEPAALDGALAAVACAHRAARLAAAFAVHRLDDDAEVLHQAALLNNFPALLLWCQAPAQALAIEERLRANPQQRSAEAQRAVLGIELAALEQALLTGWQLPSVLREMAQPGLPALPGPRSVTLAVRIARHLQAGWDNPALHEDFQELGLLLQLPPYAAQALVRQVEGS